MKALRVGLAGVGTVGGGISQILSAQRGLLAERGGRAIDLVAVADQRPIEALSNELQGHHALKHYADAVEMAQKADVDVIVETIGGYGVALKIANAALGRGVSLVTANKALLAVHAAELTVLAESQKAKIGWEAAVGGGIPCIRALREGCSANRISYAAGILNGTCNFILTTMKETGRGFEDVLAEAQSLGYAETPPDLDVDGIDTAHKLSLVAAVATGCLPQYDAVHTEGIRDISGEDVAYADELGFSVKLLGIASRVEAVEGEQGFQASPYRTCVVEGSDDQTGSLPLKPPVEPPRSRPVVLQRVHPALIPKDAALGATHGVLNGLFTMGNFVGPVFTQGRGAGREATASACVADLVDLARGSNVPTFGVAAPQLRTMQCASMEQRVGRYYLRMGDTASAAAATRAALREALIEVETISADEKALITATTLEGNLNRVVRDLGATGDAPKVIRVEGPW